MGFARSVFRHPTAAAIAAAIIVAGGALATTLDSPSSAAALPVVPAYTGPAHGDGLSRFVVRLADDASSAPSGKTSANNSDGGSNRLDLGLLTKARAALGPNGHLDADAGGNTRYVVGNRSLPVGVGARTQSDDAEDPLSTLLSQPGVVSAQRLRAGGVLLATSLDRAAVAKLPGIIDVAVSPSVPVSDAAAVPNDPYFSYDWHLYNTGWAYGQAATAGDDVDALDAWPVSTGAGVVIADLDTGMDTSHPDLAGVLWTNPKEACGGSDSDGDGHAGDCHGWNFYLNNADLDNGGDDAHGTMTAGVMVAQLNNGVGVAGLAPSAKIMPLVVGSGESVDMNAAIEAIYYAVDHGADVINCSFGGAMSTFSTKPLVDAVSYAQAHGVMISVSAGNDSANRDTSPIYPANVSNPALITVGSSDANDTASSFSAYGKNTVALYAPGSLVATTNNQGGYSVASGTSFSAPLVAATLALEKSADPNATVDQLRSRLLNSTTPVSALAALSQTGGRLNAGAALGAGPGVLRYRFGGFSDAQPDTPFNARVTVTGVAHAGQYQLRLELLTRYQGATYAVSQLPVTVGNSSATTDDTGTVTVPIDGSQFSAGQTYEPGFTLPEGTYALIAQVIADGVPISRANAAVFRVATPAPSNPDGGTPGAPSATSTPSGGPTFGPTAGPTPAPTSGPTSSPTAEPTTEPTTGPTSGPAPTAAPTGGSGGGSTVGSGDSSGSRPGGSSPEGSGGDSRGGFGGSGGGSTPAPGGGSGPGGSSGQQPTASPTSSSGSGGSSSGTAPQCPGTDQFQITGLAPTTLTTSGGLEVLTGKALPASISILVGGVPAKVLPGNSSTSATFLAPPLQPGTYDVAVYATNGAVPTTLPNALTYQAISQPGGSGGTTPSQPTAPTSPTSPSPTPTSPTSPGGGSGGDGGAGGGGATPTPTVTSAPAPAPGGTTPAPSDPTPTPAPSDQPTGQPSGQPSEQPGEQGPGETPSDSNVVTGPGGLRLVRSTVSLNWDPTACATGDCDGTPL